MSLSHLKLLSLLKFVDIMERSSSDDINWSQVQSLEVGFQPPTINEGDINYQEAQRIVAEETSRLRNPNLERVDVLPIANRQLIGPPLSLERCRELCPASFVTNTLFRPRDPSKQKDPKRKYQPKLSDLQHVGLSRVLLEKFVEKHKTIPNNHQIAVYFVQQVYCEEILGRQVQWENLRANMGVGGGRPEARKKARIEGTPVPRTKPIVLTEESHDLISSFATEGVALMTQGFTTQTISEALQKANEEKLALQIRLDEVEAELRRYKDHFGELPREASTDDRFTTSQLIGNRENLADP